MTRRRSRRPSWWAELVPLSKGRRRRVKHAASGIRRGLGLGSPLVRFPGRRFGRRYRIT